MFFRLSANILLFLFPVLFVAGCSSSITQYDRTYTSAVSTHTGSAAARSGTSARRQTAAKDKSAGQTLERPFFIEFRARKALSYGHAAVVFGRLDENGNLPVDEKGVLDPKMVEISGLHPATPSNVPWTLGHFVPVPAETGPSDGDFENAYVTASYRIDLTERQFHRIVQIVRRHKQEHQLWFAPISNMTCIGYMASIARDIGLKTPFPVKFPKEYVERLREINS